MEVNEAGQQSFTIADLKAHAGYQPASSTQNDDIALVKLSSAMTFTNKIQPIPIAPSNYVASGKI